MQVDPRIISAIAAPGGVFDADLHAIAADFKDQVAHLKASGFPIVEMPGPNGVTIYRLDVETSAAKAEAKEPRPEHATSAGQVFEMVGKLAPPDIKPPADAPSSQEADEPDPQREDAPEPPRVTVPSRDLEATFVASDFKLQSRDGMTPKIYLVPANEEAALKALDFSMRRPRGSIIEVTLRVRGTVKEATLKALAKVAKEAAASMAGESATEGTKGGGMPIYEYACTACGHEFEELQSVTEGGKAKCPECGAAAERLISRPQPAIIRENEKRPTEKGKAQIERELSQQVNNGELPAGLANAQAGLAKL